MKKTKKKIFGVLIIAIVLAVGLILYKYSAYEPGFEQGFDQGKQEAEHDLKIKNPRIYTLGYLEPYKNYDQSTGLTCHAIAGCFVTQFDLGRVEGYNRIIDNFIKLNGIPVNSRLQWKNEILAPVKYLDNVATSAFIDLLNDSKSQDFDNGKFSITVLTKTDSDPNTKETYLQRDILLKRKEYEDTVLCLPGSGLPLNSLTLIWGPDGSDLAFLRYQWTHQEEKYIGVGVLDLREGAWLNDVYVK